MAIVRTGTEITINTASPDSSQSITVPSDAQIAIAFLSAYSSSVTIANPTLTLAGTGLTRLVATGVVSTYNSASLEYMLNPPTGSQTLAWDFTSWFGGSSEAGCHIVVVFYKGIDTATPFKDSDGGQNLGNITGLTYATGDMMVGGVASDGTGIDVAVSGQTQIHESSVDAIATQFVLAVGEKLSTDTFDYTGESAPAAVACILALASSDVIVGTVCFGHIAGAEETNTKTFTGNGSGTATISGSGDSEKLAFQSGQYWNFTTVNTNGERTVTITIGKYTAADTVTIKYRTGATQVACEAASFSTYSAPVASLGFIQARLER